MIGTITPQFEWDKQLKRRSGRSFATTFAFGSIAAGAASFGLVGFLGSRLPVGRLPAIVVTLCIACVAVVYGVSYLRHRPMPIPTSSWQVPRLWREVFPPSVTGLLYGSGLGVGVLTRVPFVLYYIVLALIALDGTTASAFMTGAVYGIGRLAPIVSSVLARSSEAHVDVVERLLRRRPGVETIIGVLQLVVAAVLVVLASHPNWLTDAIR